MKYYLIAGEASGDLHASNLMRALKKHDHEADFRFYGGDKMEVVGGTLVKHYRELAYMGFIPVLLHLRTILRNMKQCKQDIVAWKPDVVILVDYPGFNLNVAQFLRKSTHIPSFYYIAPKIWAWKEYRIKNIRRDINELFSILPFEVEFFETKHNYPIHYVGNPCVDSIAQFLQRKEKCLQTSSLTSSAQQHTIAILAGSRTHEIKDNLATMLHAAAHFPTYRLVLAAAPNIELEFYKKYIPQGINVEIVYNQTYDVLSNAVAALVTSGTATLETAILRVPQVVCYHLNFGCFFRFLKRHFLKVKWISLVNLVANREIVTELIGDQMNVENVVKELGKILPNGTRHQQILNDYEEMNRVLGPAGASERAAAIMVEKLKNKRS